MHEPTLVGSTVTLPDGTAVKVTVAADPARPWKAIQMAQRWQVCREHCNETWAGASHYFGGGKRPVQLDEESAKALADVLNVAQAAL